MKLNLNCFKFAPLVTLVQSDVSNELEVSVPFLFRYNWKHVTDGRTDGRWTGCST